MPSTDANEFAWTPRYEMEYWARETDNLRWMRRKMESLGVPGLDASGVRTMVDIGGGKYGGALGFFPGVPRRVLIDPLAHELAEFGEYPEGIEFSPGSVLNIPLPDDIAQVLFCMEVLDHLPASDFPKAVAELKRVLAPGGLLFFHLPLRYEPREGHPLSTQDITPEDVLAAFGMERRLTKLYPCTSKTIIYAVFTK